MAARSAVTGDTVGILVLLMLGDASGDGLGADVGSRALAQATSQAGSRMIPAEMRRRDIRPTGRGPDAWDWDRLGNISAIGPDTDP
jgi:hypothetical protein